jgi:hypothetical protein
LESQTISAKGKGRGKAGVKQLPKKAAKQPISPKGKIKSAEIIEDSDEEYGVGEAGDNDDEEEDEFAKMVGESLAVDGLAVDEDQDEEDDDDEEEDEDEDELGGAKLVMQNQSRSSGQ